MPNYGNKITLPVIMNINKEFIKLLNTASLNQPIKI